MKHSDWESRFKAAMLRAAENPAEASAMLTALAAEAEKSAWEMVGDWHQDQAIGSAADILEESRNLVGALKLYEEALELRRNHSTYWMIATTHMLAVVARLQFRLGHVNEGMAAGREMLRYLSLVPQAADSIVLEVAKEVAGRTLEGGAAYEVGQH
jgi:hypothetical protein